MSLEREEEKKKMMKKKKKKIKKIIIVIIRGTTFEDTISTVCPLVELGAVNIRAIWCIFIVAKTFFPYTEKGLFITHVLPNAQTCRVDLILVNYQLDALFFSVFISLLYMLRAAQCSSSGESSCFSTSSGICHSGNK